ncbi:MAG TPA: hypothetical protein VJ965_03130 [Anaerolineales bacterium]|nr:hypothetical protein [Anaerolineales bacterium]
MKPKPTLKLVLWLALAVLLAAALAACGADTTALQEPDTSTANNEAEAPAQLAVNDDGRLAMPELGFAPGDPDLKASDPANFVRAAGTPQMVELFAFW